MPLRVVTRTDTGKLWIVGTIVPAGARSGYRIRQRAGTNDPALAREEAAALEREILRNIHLGQRPVERGFAQAVTAYCQAEPRARQTIAQMQRLLRHFGNVPLRTINQDALDDARKVLLRPDAASGTVRRNLIVPLRAVLKHAHRRGWCDEPAFDVPTEPEGRTDFLTPEQVGNGGSRFLAGAPVGWCQPVGMSPCLSATRPVFQGRDGGELRLLRCAGAGVVRPAHV